MEQKTEQKTYFTFVERELTLCFFAENPVEVKLAICAENDAKFDTLPADLKTAEGYGDRFELLCGLIGRENALALLDRADRQDDYAISQVLLYLHRAYLEGRAKNLHTAAAGRAV